MIDDIMSDYLIYIAIPLIHCVDAYRVIIV